MNNIEDIFHFIDAYYAKHGIFISDLPLTVQSYSKIIQDFEALRWFPVNRMIDRNAIQIAAPHGVVTIRPMTDADRHYFVAKLNFRNGEEQTTQWNGLPYQNGFDACINRYGLNFLLDVASQNSLGNWHYANYYEFDPFKDYKHEGR